MKVALTIAGSDSSGGVINAYNTQEIAQEKPDMISVVSGVLDGNITANVKNLLTKMQR